MVFRLRHKLGGGHVHCRLFVAPATNQTFAKCGDFCVSAGAEFDALRASAPGWEFIEDGDGYATEPRDPNQSLQPESSHA